MASSSINLQANDCFVWDHRKFVEAQSCASGPRVGEDADSYPTWKTHSVSIDPSSLGESLIGKHCFICCDADQAHAASVLDPKTFSKAAEYNLGKLPQTRQTKSPGNSLSLEREHQREKTFAIWFTKWSTLLAGQWCLLLCWWNHVSRLLMRKSCKVLLLPVAAAALFTVASGRLESRKIREQVCVCSDEKFIEEIFISIKNTFVSDNYLTFVKDINDNLDSKTTKNLGSKQIHVWQSCILVPNVALGIDFTG